MNNRWQSLRDRLKFENDRTIFKATVMEERASYTSLMKIVPIHLPIVTWYQTSKIPGHQEGLSNMGSSVTIRINLIFKYTFYFSCSEMYLKGIV